MSVSLSRMDGPGDAELIAAVRGGDVDAYGELFARHVDAARRLARQIAGPSDAEDLVSDAFTKVLTVLQRGGGPDLAFRAYLLTAVRRLHVDRVRSGARLRPVDDLTPFDPGLPFQDTAVEGFDNAAAARAFASLPERWQMVLWHTEVEQQKPADVAPLLGMSANSVSALAYRAREGLRQAFLSQHAADPDDVDCSWTRDHLGAYIRGGLSRRDAARVDDHLESCRACAAVYLELTEVNSGLALILAPLLLGTAGAAYLTSTGAAGAAAGGLSATWTATKTFLGGHTAVTAVGGVMLTAVASVAVYVGAHAMLANPSTDTAGDLHRPLHSATGPANPGGNGPGDGPGGSHVRSTDRSSAGTDPSLTDPSSSPSVPTTDDSTSPTEPTSDTTGTDGTDPGTDPSSGTTDGPGGPSTDPTSGPSDPGGPGGDTLTFSSTPPVNPSFGDTYELKASGGSGAITFSIDSDTTNHACTLAGSTVTFRHAGKCVINASQGGDRGARAAAKPVRQVVVVPKEDQVVDFSAPKGSSVGQSADLNATGGDSGNDVTFSVDPATTNDACTLDGTTVRYLHTGTCVIAAHQAGSDDYHAADPVTRTTDVAKGSQTIHFTSDAPDSPAFGDTYQVSATGGDSGNPVTFSLDPATTNDACTLDGTTVTIDHAGTCVIAADQAGNDDYSAASRDQSTEVAKATQAIHFTSDAPDSPAFGDTYQVSATGGDSGNPVTFSLDPATTNDACTLDGTTVTIDHAGTCVIAADQAGNDDYTAAATRAQPTDVPKAKQSITFTSDAPQAPSFGDSYDVTARSTSGQPVTFSVDPATTNDACTLDGSTVTIDHAGTCVIAADQAGNDDYTAAATATQTASVPRAQQSITFTSKAPSEPAPGDSYDVSATGGDSGNPVTFSLDPATTNDACTLDGTTVTVHHAGACVIAADQAGNDDYAPAATVTQTASVPRAQQSITFTTQAPTAPTFGATYDVAATSTSGLPVTLSIGSGTTGNACTLDGSTVTFRHAGTCVIAADQAGNDDYAPAKTVTQVVVVPRASQSITFDAPPDSSVGRSHDLSATGGDSGNPVTFSVDPATTHNACTVQGSTVSYLHAGTCVIAADQAGNDDYAPAATVTGSVQVSKAQQSITFTSQAPTAATFGATYDVSATSTSGLPVSFSIAAGTTNEACTVDGSTVTFRHAGTCVIAADQAGDDDYLAAATVTQIVKVSKAEQTISFTSDAPTSPAFGDTYTPTATSTSGLPVSFSIDPSTRGVCTVDGSTVTFRHAGTCLIAADQAGNDDFAAAKTVTQAVSVPRAQQQVSFTSQAPTAPAFGATYGVSATSTSGLPVSFSIAAGTTNEACTVNGSTVTFRHAGTCVIAADQAGNDDYAPAKTVTQVIAVPKSAQSITITSSAPASPTIGATYPVTATSTSGLPVTLSIGAGTTRPACTLDGSTITFRHTGTCVIAADQAGNDDYTAAKTVTQVIAVPRSAQSITFSSTAPPSPAVGDTYAVAATSTSGLPVALSIASGTTNGACTLSGSTVTYRHPGTCVIAADQAGNDDFTPAPTKTQTSVVRKAPQTITFTSTAPSPGIVGATYTVAATGGGSGSPVVFSSATGTVCTVSGSTVTFRTAGSCRIAANQAGSADYDAASQVVQSIDVQAPATDLSVSASVSDHPPTSDPHWHRVDVTVHGLVAGATATVTGSSGTSGVYVIPQFNCWFERDAICHVTSPPVNPTVTFYTWLPSNVSSANVTFTVASATSPDPDKTNDSVTVTIRSWDDNDDRQS